MFLLWPSAILDYHHNCTEIYTRAQTLHWFKLLIILFKLICIISKFYSFIIYQSQRYTLHFPTIMIGVIILIILSIFNSWILEWCWQRFRLSCYIFIVFAIKSSLIFYNNFCNKIISFLFIFASCGFLPYTCLYHMFYVCSLKNYLEC